MTAQHESASVKLILKLGLLAYDWLMCAGRVVASGINTHVSRATAAPSGDMETEAEQFTDPTAIRFMG
jgi:hypothetical protein